MQERIEQQEKKITTLELTRKLANSGTNSAVKDPAGQLVKKLEELQTREKDVIKQKQKLQEENTKLKYEMERYVCTKGKSK